MVSWPSIRTLAARLSLCLGVLTLALSSCSGGAAEQLHIRIRNDSTENIDKFWLGSGGTGPRVVPFGGIPSGETTDYRALNAVLSSYGKSDFITDDGQRYLNTIDPAAYVGSDELAPGYYTFAYDIVGDESVLTITRDR